MNIPKILILIIGTILFVGLAVMGVAKYRQNSAVTFVEQLGESSNGLEVIDLSDSQGKEPVAPESGDVLDVAETVDPSLVGQLRALSTDLGADVVVTPDKVLPANQEIALDKGTYGACTCFDESRAYSDRLTSVDIINDNYQDFEIADSATYLERAQQERDQMLYAFERLNSYDSLSSAQSLYVQCLLTCPSDIAYAPSQIQSLLSGAQTGDYSTGSVGRADAGKKMVCSDSVIAARKDYASILAQREMLKVDFVRKSDLLLGDILSFEDFERQKMSYGEFESLVLTTNSTLNDYLALRADQSDTYHKLVSACNDGSLVYGSHLRPSNIFYFVSALRYNISALFVEAFYPVVSKYAFYVKEYSKSLATAERMIADGKDASALDSHIEQIRSKIELYGRVIENQEISANRLSSFKEYQLLFEEL